MPARDRRGSGLHHLRSALSNDRRQGWLGEVSWKFQGHLRFGLGYNFTQFSDDEFPLDDYSASGWFFRLQGMY